jgi:hypothetical protein
MTVWFVGAGPGAPAVKRVGLTQVVIDAVDDIGEEFVPVLYRRISDSWSMPRQPHRQLNIRTKLIRPGQKYFRISSGVRSANQPHARFSRARS